jgi:hypothetical protein
LHIAHGTREAGAEYAPPLQEKTRSTKSWSGLVLGVLGGTGSCLA